MRNFLLFILLSSLIIIAGCSEKATETDPATEIEKPQPIDGDLPAAVANMLDIYTDNDSEPVLAEWGSNLGPNAVDIACNTELYSVTFLWGDLFNTGAATEDTTDWTGQAYFNGVGSMNVRLTIDFEDGLDYLIPTTNETTVAWVSQTKMDLDGISLLISVRTDINYFAAPYLTFETEEITLQFYFSELVNLTAFYMTDNMNGVAIHARKIWQNSCPGGTIDGFWIKNESFGDDGWMSGYWLDYAGDTIGIMSGTFSETNDTYPHSGRFEGSVSGLYTDVVLIEFEGFFMYDDMRMCPMCGKGHGVFVGKFRHLMENRRGFMAGQFGDYSIPPDDIEMPLSGIWQYRCPWSTLYPDDD